MSFILDALRKSEHERQRGAVPGISHVPFAPPRRETPRWMMGLVAALVLALVALGGAWWRASRAVPEPPAVASVPLEVPPPAVPPAEKRSAPAETPAAPPDVGAGPDETRSARVEPPRTSPAEERAPPDARDEPSPAEPPAQTAAAVRAPPPAAERDDSSDEPPLPSSAALAAEGISVPPLHLELHAYSDRPAERFVFINGRKYGEGQTLDEGPRLVAIERTGVVLSQQGRRFLLTQ
ncbi:MAG TPA: general secretion pathway protein GspB [Gammaproteobacteria bacterium]|nr:general secretion pathway protein GspB [Gammaproteobacteria bacterium]